MKTKIKNIALDNTILAGEVNMALAARTTRVIVRRPLLPTPGPALDFGILADADDIPALVLDLTPEDVEPNRFEKALDLLASCNMFQK